MNLRKKFLVLCMTAVLAPNVQADDKEELLKLRATTMSLIDALVREGILSKQRADEIVQQAEQKADAEVRRAEREQVEKAADPKVVRVPYVPQFVRDEIREEVRAELREDVVQDVMAQAKTQRWGVPNALPEWISRFKFSGDIRLRAENIDYSGNNPEFTFFDYQQTNEDGSLQPLNVTSDRFRLRERVRLGIDAKVSSNLKAGLRITTGSLDDPVSTNQTLGNSYNRFQLGLDRAYLQYSGYDLDGRRWLKLSGGRFKNPFFSTSLVWDRDIAFDGVAATFSRGLGGSDSLYDIDESPREVFATIGAFPLQEEELTSSDKWLFAGQIGSKLEFRDQSSLTLGAAYYDFYNYEGELNNGGINKNYSAPEYMQKGNSVFQISDASIGSPLLVGLAPEFKLLNLTARYDFARFAPMHFIFLADYVQNIGYDSGDIRDRIGGDMRVNSTLAAEDPSSKENEGWLTKLTVGWPDTRMKGRWQASLAYKHLERDAVVDGFTDSDFHVGGTNAKGWILGGKYGLMDDTWIQARWISADEIEGPSMGVDTFQLDLNSAF